MCNKTDNSCRQEKLGCKGCFYERKSEYNDLLNTLIHTDFLEGACSEETANDYKQAIEQLIYENMKLKAITKTYNAYNTERDDDKIILADKRYFDCGVFSDNLIAKSKIIDLKRYYEEQAEETKMAYGKLRNISNLYRIYRKIKEIDRRELR